MMKQFVPYEKLSKRQRREMDQAKRATWGNTNPVTKKIESAKHYNRKKHRRMDEIQMPVFFYVMGNCAKIRAVGTACFL